MKGLVILLGAAAVAGGAMLALVRVECERCGGSGQITQPHVVERTCTHCGGRGLDRAAPRPARDGVRRLGDARPKCLHCRGAGKERVTVAVGPCPACGGRESAPLYRWLLDRLS